MGNGPHDTLLDPVVDDVLQARRDAALAAASLPNVPTEDHVRADYFGARQEHAVPLPDGVSSITHRTLMEGEKRRYMNAVNRDLTLNRKTQDAKLKLAPGDDRTELFKLAIVGWDLVRDGRPLPFSPQNLNLVLDQFPPEVLDVVEADIRKHNRWLLADISIEDIDEQITELNELRAQKVADEEGNGGSSS